MAKMATDRRTATESNGAADRHQVNFRVTKKFLSEMQIAARRYRTPLDKRVSFSHFMRVACADYAGRVLKRSVKPM